MTSLNTSIDRDSHIPYYVQVRDALQMHIERGAWQPGDQLPGEPDLCLMFNVSRPVIRQALQELESRGLVRREKGKGTFVAEPKIIESWVQTLTGFYQGMVERGLTPVTKVLRHELTGASATVATRLELAVGDPIVEIERLRYIGDEPIMLATTYIPHKLCPALAEADLSTGSLYEFLERECGLVIARGRRTLEAVLASEYDARLFEIEPGAPLVLLNSVSYLEDGTPVEYYHALHRGDRARFEVELVRIRQQGTLREVLGEDRPLPPGI